MIVQLFRPIPSRKYDNMNCRYLIKDNNPSLLLFFSGWGGEEALFRNYRPTGADWLFCDDYRSLDFDTGLLSGYDEIRVAAWSLGVWVAGHVLENTQAPFGDKVAVNGTMMPVDDAYGIPEKIFKGTLEHLDEASLRKFRRRMCESSAALDNFMSHGPQRTAAVLKDELDVLYHAVKGCPPPDFKWTAALVGTADMIFPFRSQEAFWSRCNVPVSVYDEAHYSERLFRAAIGCMGQDVSGREDCNG